MNEDSEMKSLSNEETIEENRRIRERYIRRGFDELPFYYTHVSSHSVTPELMWVCALDEEGRITSVYKNFKLNEKFAMYLKDIREAISYRNKLIGMGWVEFTPPAPNFSENKNAPPISKLSE